MPRGIWFIPTYVGLILGDNVEDAIIERFIPTYVGLMLEIDGKRIIKDGSSPHTWG